MPAISFSTLKEKLLSGEKKQTIRPLSPYWLRWKKGDRLVGYWKMRTKHCEKLFDSTFSEDPWWFLWIRFDNHLARLDGFKNTIEANQQWFIPHYGEGGKIKPFFQFVVIRWN